MAGGALKSLKELSGAATYGVYYFATRVTDPFGDKPHKPNKPHRNRWNGHNHRVKH